MGSEGLNRCCHDRLPLLSGRRNRCVIFPAIVAMTAQALEQSKLCWYARNNIESNLTIHVGESRFHLHQLPMVSRSGYVNRLVFQRRSNGERDSATVIDIHIENLPGGTKSLELVTRFCYGLPVDLTATNIASLYCAAHFLEMTEELEQGNLISRTEAFLSFVIFSSWKDTIKILKSCESLSSWAEDLKIVKRCSESIAWKACTNPLAISNGDDEAECLNILTSSRIDMVTEGWWFKDVSFLTIDHFVEVINEIKEKGARSQVIGASITYWAANWFSTLKVGIHGKIDQVSRLTVENLIRICPKEKNSVSCNFLLHIYKVALMININPELVIQLEIRVAMMLENCEACELLVKNNGDGDSVYDVYIVIRVLEAYVEYASSNSGSSKMPVVGRVVDEYLTLVARDDNLSVKSFQLLAEALPDNARHCHDYLYRAIDMYLKSHPSLTEEERRIVCRAMDYPKLSVEARKHALKNDRLPLNITVRFILLEQLCMARSILEDRSNYTRTKLQAFINVKKYDKKGWKKCQKELKILKQQVNRMKVLLNEINLCRVDLQRQVETVEKNLVGE